jgi:ribosome-associated toxin RatA of RatAB toxin-antitoxin module
MKHVRKSVLLWYSSQEMYDLVTGVQAYPTFLPWCRSAEVLHQHDDGITARLGLAYMGVQHAFTTRNVQVPNELVTLSLVDGPFSTLEGTWHFRSLGGAKGGKASTSTSASASPSACKIEFEMRYAFASPALEAVVSPVFDKVANTFVDSFVKRAEEVYGAR